MKIVVILFLIVIGITTFIICTMVGSSYRVPTKSLDTDPTYNIYGVKNLPYCDTKGGVQDIFVKRDSDAKEITVHVPSIKKNTIFEVYCNVKTNIVKQVAWINDAPPKNDTTANGHLCEFKNPDNLLVGAYYATFDPQIEVTTTTDNWQRRHISAYRYPNKHPFYSVY